MKREKKKVRAKKSVQPQSPEFDVEQVPSSISVDSIHSNHGEQRMSKKFDFNSLVAAEKQQSVDDLGEYQQVLREIAQDSCDRPQSEILRLLERCDRTTEDLKEDVAWRVERDEMIFEIQREKEYRSQNDDLLAQLKSLWEEFERVEAEYHATRNPISWQSSAFDDKLRNISRYRDDLLRSCRDIHLKLELETLEQSFDDRMEYNIYERQNRITSEISQREHEIENLPITVDRQERKKALKMEIKRLQEEWQQLELKKEEVDRKKIELFARNKRQGWSRWGNQS